MRQKRWMMSVLAAAREKTPPLPFQRGRRKPIATRREDLPARKAA